MAEKITYKNHCTPQEQADFTTGNDRYYLDSDVGRKLTGTCESKASTTGSLVTGTFVDIPLNLTSSHFIYIKNTDTSGSAYLLVNIGDMGPVIKLMAGESFASDVMGSYLVNKTTVVVTGSGLPTFEYITGT